MLAATMADRGKQLGSQAQRLVFRLRDFFVAEKEHGGPFLPVSERRCRAIACSLTGDRVPCFTIANKSEKLLQPEQTLLKK